MEKVDVAPRQQQSREPGRSATARSLLKRYWDLLAVVLLMLASFPTVWLAQRTVTLVPNLGLIDDNWHLDGTWKALRGIWIGRDVAFTHGPIFQWLSSIPAHSLPLTFGALYATWNTIPLWCAYVFAYLALRLILPEQPAWKRFVLLLLLACFWDTSLRSTVPVLLFAVFLRGWYAVREGRMRSSYAGVAGAVLCSIAFLVAGDVGIYATAAWFICWFAIALEMRRQSFSARLLPALLSFAGSFVVLAIVVNSFTAAPFDFKFWRDSLAQVGAYRWATPLPMSEKGATHFAVALLICTVTFIFRALSRRRDGASIAHRTAFLVGAYVLGLAVMQSALVRSDMGHVIIGQFAMVFFAGAILFSFEGSAAVAAIVFAVGASMLFSHPVFRPSSIMRLYGQLRHPMTQCPPGYKEFEQACYVEPLTPQMLTAGGNFLSAHSEPKQSVFVYPYQTMLGLAARRDVAGGLMQAYTASGPYLSRLEISRLEGKSIPAALYFTDDDYDRMTRAETERWLRNYLSVPVDAIPNFTRTPEVWFWLLRHYRAAEQLTPGVVGLVRDDSRAQRITMLAQPLGSTPRTYAITERAAANGIGVPSWPLGYDFIRLRITVHYPLWWKLRKPERLQLEITRADGTGDVQWFILEPNVSSEVWFYPWNAPDLGSYFATEEAQWRPSSRSPIVALRVLTSPLDWVSQQPDAVTIEAAEAVKVVMTPQP